MAQLLLQEYGCGGLGIGQLYVGGMGLVYLDEAVSCLLLLLHRKLPTACSFTRSEGKERERERERKRERERERKREREREGEREGPATQG